MAVLAWNEALTLSFSSGYIINPNAKNYRFNLKSNSLAPNKKVNFVSFVTLKGDVTFYMAKKKYSEQNC